MDPNQHVKSALASVIMGLSPMLGKDKYVWLMFLFSFTVVFHTSAQMNVFWCYYFLFNVMWFIYSCSCCVSFLLINANILVIFSAPLNIFFLCSSLC